MTPFASVAMLEKLALLKIALCKAPALSSASSACLCAVLSVLSDTRTRALVTSLSLVMAFVPGNLYSHHWRMDSMTSKLRCEQVFNRVFELLWRVRLTKEVCAFNKQCFHLVGNGIACRVEHTQFRPKLDCLVREFTPAKDRCFEID